MAEVTLTAAFSTIPGGDAEAIKRLIVETVEQIARDDKTFQRAKLVFTESDERCGLTADRRPMRGGDGEGVMSAGGRGAPPRHVPTLTEVVDPSTGPRPGATVSERASPEALRRLAEAAGPPPPSAAAAAPSASAADPDAAPPDEAALLQRLGAELQRQVEAAVEERLERRVQEVLAPTLARITEALVLESREQLAELLRELVAEAVAAELARRAPR